MSSKVADNRQIQKKIAFSFSTLALFALLTTSLVGYAALSESTPIGTKTNTATESKITVATEATEEGDSSDDFLSIEEELRRQQEQQLITDARNRLLDIAEAKKAKEQQVKEQLLILRQATTDEQKKEVQATLDLLRQELKDLDTSFDQISTGGVQLSEATKYSTSGFDWKADLDDILLPIFQSLKELTEKPREIEKLRSKAIFYKNRIKTLKKGLSNLEKTQAHNKSDVVKRKLKETEENWLEMLKESEREYGIAQFQLNEKMNTTNSFLESTGKALADFFSGRGLNLLSGLLAFSITLLILHFVDKQLNLLAKPELMKGKKGLTIRVGLFAFKILSYIIAFGALIMVFYVKGDWILLGITILLTIAMLLMMKNSFINYFGEVKLVLNVGSVRQGERVFYNGLPWILTTINVYPTLTNPALSGGNIRIKLDELIDLNSRPVQQDEPWFPTKLGDYAMLNDTTFCQVLLQTPGCVKIAMAGGSIKTFAASEFYSANVRNLSAASFAIAQTFGLDYNLQRIATTDIPKILLSDLKNALSKEIYESFIKDLFIEFEEAAASSLNYKIIAIMGGEAAQHYGKIGRDIQKACVDTANREGWNIPFNQVTVNQGNGFELLHQQTGSRLLDITSV